VRAMIPRIRNAETVTSIGDSHVKGVSRAYKAPGSLCRGVPNLLRHIPPRATNDVDPLVQNAAFCRAKNPSSIRCALRASAVC
jgi:hypothetical protein